MKKITLILAGLLVFSLTKAQSGKEPSYLFSPDGKHSFSGFGGPIIQFGQIENSFATFAGGGGAFLINQRFFIGGYGMGLATNHLRNDVEIGGRNYQHLRTSFGHGGFWIGYIHDYARLVHFGLSGRFGWGQLALYDDRYYTDHYDFMARDNVFVANPQVEVEVNMTTWFKLNIGLGYSGVIGVDENMLDGDGRILYRSSDYNSVSGTVSLLFGNFR